MPNARRTAIYRAEGKCRSCGAEPVTGRVICWTCSERQRKRKKKLKDEGMCVGCASVKALDGHTRCAECNNKEISRDIKRKAEGMCVKCGRKAAAEGRGKCDACHSRWMLWRFAKSYGCPLEQAEAWLLRCKTGNCDICGKKASACKRGCLFADHSHTAVPIPRGCLCEDCNPTLGHLEKVLLAGPLFCLGVLSDNQYVRYLQQRDPRYGVVST